MVTSTLETTRVGLPEHGGMRGRSVKWVTCIIRAERLMAVAEALNQLNLVGGMTVTDLRGSGNESPATAVFLGNKFAAPFIQRVKIELAVEASDVDRVEELILTTARTGQVGDGKIFHMSVKDLMRVRTGERGTSAL